MDARRKLFHFAGPSSSSSSCIGLKFSPKNLRHTNTHTTRTIQRQLAEWMKHKQEDNGDRVDICWFLIATGVTPSVDRSPIAVQMENIVEENPSSTCDMVLYIKWHQGFWYLVLPIWVLKHTLNRTLAIWREKPLNFEFQTIFTCNSITTALRDPLSRFFVKFERPLRFDQRLNVCI